MQYKVEYLPIFAEDVRDAVAYIADTLRNVSAANDLLDALESRIDTIKNDPYIALKYRGTHELDDEIYWFSVKNYMVFYVVHDNVIEFRRFLYGRRNIADCDMT